MRWITICLKCKPEDKIFRRARGIIFSYHNSGYDVSPLFPTTFSVVPPICVDLDRAGIPYAIVRGDVPQPFGTYDKRTVYFGAAIRGDRSRKHIVSSLIDYIQSLGVPVLSEHVGVQHPDVFLAQKAGMTREDITMEYIEQQDMEWLDQCTHAIFEVSGASIGVGMEIAYARVKGQLGYEPARFVLCLYDTIIESSVSAMVLGMNPDQYPNVMVRSYRHIDEAKAIVKEVLESR